MKSFLQAMELDRVQQWMQSVIMHPEGVEAGIKSASARSQIDVSPDQIEKVICRSSVQTSMERLQVYANAYYARLLEVLEAEFPALRHALGEELFQDFAFGYLQEYPSQSYTLNDLSAKFPEYLRRTRPPRESLDAAPDWADFLIDLTTLERTYSEVFDGPGTEQEKLLQPDELKQIALDDWMNVRLVSAPCLRLLSLKFPVHEYATDVRLKKNPEIPQPSPTWLVITRRNYVVRRTAIQQAEFAAFQALVDGKTIAESLDAAEQNWTGTFEDLASEVRRWFRDWAAAGYFLKIASTNDPLDEDQLTS